MNEPTRKRFEARAEVFKAMGHPTRLFMLEELTRGPRCVCELQEMVAADMSTVSKHLSILRGVGLVECERRGTQMIYSITCECFGGFVKCLESVLSANRQRLAELK